MHTKTALLLLFSVGIAALPAVAQDSSTPTDAGPLAEQVVNDDLDGDPPIHDQEFERLHDSGVLRLLDPSRGESTQIMQGARSFEAVPHGLAELFAVDPDSVLGLDQDAGAEFHLFALGQADSMLVIGPTGRTLLYDLGELNWNSRSNCLRVRDEIFALTGRYHLDYLVLSHFHQDHVGAPPSVFRRRDGRERIQQGGGIFCLLDSARDFFHVGTLIDRGDGEQDYRPERKRSHQYLIDSVDRWIASGSLDRRVPAEFGGDFQIDLGPGVAVELLAVAGRVAEDDAGAFASVEEETPDETYRADQPASPNDFSVALEFTVGESFELFTAGDLTGAPGEPPQPPFQVTRFDEVYTDVETHMVDAWRRSCRESNVEVYIVNHHGSRNSSTPGLINALQPEVVVYSAGGKYRHPSRTIAERIFAAGADQLVTSSVDEDEWPHGNFPDRYGRGWMNPVGDILIFAPVTGSHYTVATREQAFDYAIETDAAEAAGEQPCVPETDE